MITTSTVRAICTKGKTLNPWKSATDDADKCRVWLREISRVDLEKVGGFALDGEWIKAIKGVNAEEVYYSDTHVFAGNTCSPVYYILCFNWGSQPDRKAVLLKGEAGAGVLFLGLSLAGFGNISLELLDMVFLGEFDHISSSAAVNWNVYSENCINTVKSPTNNVVWSTYGVANPLYRVAVILAVLGVQAVMFSSASLSGNMGSTSSSVSVTGASNIPTINISVKKNRGSRGKIQDAGFIEIPTIDSECDAGLFGMERSELSGGDPDKMRERYPELPTGIDYQGFVSGILFLRTSRHKLLFLNALMERVDKIKPEDAEKLVKVLDDQAGRLEGITQAIRITADVLRVRGSMPPRINPKRKKKTEDTPIQDTGSESDESIPIP
jgi:hypothetical protein